MSSGSIILVISTILMVAGLVITYWLHSQYQLDVIVQKRLAQFDGKPPSISVIVPARNEERNIHRCIQALLAQDYSDYQIIVVNDRSTDRTSQLLAEIENRIEINHHFHDMHGNSRKKRLVVLQGQELPPGWAGKPHALFQAASHAHGDWLCFIDADTFASPELLDATISTAHQFNTDLFTILTDQILGSFWEKVVLPLVFTALSVGFSPKRVNDPTKPDAIANGQFILIRRNVYQALGGHKAIADQIVEDKALAELAKRNGYRLTVADGRKVARTRMYTSLAEIWEGWTKNIYLGMRGRLGLLLFGALVGLIAAVALPLWLAGGIIWAIAGAGLTASLVVVESLLLWGYLLWNRVRAAHAFHISPWYAFTLPLGALIFTAMMVVSAFNVVSGKGVTWKGRRYV